MIGVSILSSSGALRNETFVRRLTRTSRRINRGERWIFIKGRFLHPKADLLQCIVGEKFVGADVLLLVPAASACIAEFLGQRFVREQRAQMGAER